MRRRPLVLIRGAGDLASGCAYRLHRCGFDVVMTELPAPRAVRRATAFSEAVYEGRAVVEGVEARLARDPAGVRRILARGRIALLVDPHLESLRSLRPAIVVDAAMAKRNSGIRRTDAPLTIGLGPGFTAGRDVHAVIETNRGHTLGRVILRGRAAPDTGKPGPVGGYAEERVLRAPASGILRGSRRIGDLVEAGQVIASVEAEGIVAPFRGVIRGLLRDGTRVVRGQKVGDLDPRCRRAHCFTISDKSLAVAGGLLEAILYRSRTLRPRDGLRALPRTTRPSRPAPAAKRASPKA